jgi:hypothetical protein
MSTTCLLVQAAQYCAHHSVDVGAVVYLVKVPRCIGDACSKQAIFGYKGKPPICCKTCIPETLRDEVINVRSKRCEVEGCDTQPSFGDPKEE